MSEKIFKGFKQVSATKFQEAKDANTLAGYLWFVRTEVPEAEGVNNVANDEYDIYFGSRHYGHFCEGELPAIKSAIEQNATDIEGILSTLEEFAKTLQTNTEAILANKTAHETNANDIQALQTALESFLVKNVDSNDKVLNVADGILTSEINLVYENSYIKLFGKSKEVTTTDENGEEVVTTTREELGSIDASVFIKDSVLDDVAVVEIDGEKYLEFKWKVETEDEEPKFDRIKISEFAKLYSAGTALELDENDKFNVKVAANDNFLSVNANNELIVDDMTVDKTLLKEAITIEGGPLATDAVKGAFKDGVIPAGTDIQAVLKALLCVEIYPAPTANTPTYSVSITAPTVSASGISSGALVEVGQTINFNAVTATTVSINPTHPQVKTFTHGYADSLTGDTVMNGDKIATAVTASWTIAPMSNQTYQLSAEIVTGFTGTVPTTVQNATASTCVLAACELVAAEGTNTYKVTEDAPKHSGSHPGVESKYIISNLGGKSEDEKSPAISATTNNVERDPANKSGEFTVTGVYPVFTNGVSASTTDATAAAMTDLAAHVSGDGTKLALMTAGTSFAVSFAAHTKGVEGYRLYLPGSWKVKSAMAINANTAKYAVDQKSKFVALDDKVERTIQGNIVEYTVYEYLATEGANRVKFTVGQ